MTERPIVMLPQFAGSKDLMERFRRTVELYMRPVHVIEPPGFGDRPPPSGLPSLRHLAEAVIERWDEMGIGRAHLFGISIGGMIAQWVAIDAPDKIDRLVLASTAPSGLTTLAASLHPLAMARCLFHPGVEATDCLVEGALSEQLKKNEPRMREIQVATTSHARGKSELIWLATAAAAHNARAELSRVRAPTLILTGSADPMIPPEAQALFLDCMPDARQEMVVGCAHDLTLEMPEETAARVAAFLGSPSREVEPPISLAERRAKRDAGR